MTGVSLPKDPDATWHCFSWLWSGFHAFNNLFLKMSLFQHHYCPVSLTLTYANQLQLYPHWLFNIILDLTTGHVSLTLCTVNLLSWSPLHVNTSFSTSLDMTTGHASLTLCTVNPIKLITSVSDIPFSSADFTVTYLVLKLSRIQSDLLSSIWHFDAAIANHYKSAISFHQAPITAGWTEAAWYERLAQRSPIQILTGLDAASLKWSEGNWLPLGHVLP